jgi:invasion protein IalB
MNRNQSFAQRTGVLALLAVAVGSMSAVANQSSVPRAAGQTAQGLPGGATSLQETHGDWRVTCVQQDGRNLCALSQQQTDKETRQLVVSIEVTAQAEDRIDATLVLPFGLAVDKPVAIEIDETPAGRPLSFKTCLPVGCLVSLTLDAATIARLKVSTVLIVKAAAHDGQPVAFKIPLSGFSGGFARMVALTKI